MFPFSYFIYDFFGGIIFDSKPFKQIFKYFFPFLRISHWEFSRIVYSFGKNEKSANRNNSSERRFPNLKFCLHLLAEFYHFTHIDILRPRYLNNILLEEWRETLEWEVFKGKRKTVIPKKEKDQKE